VPDFVIHKHTADRAGLHYDLRLESGGVLKSWALPKGMPTERGIKRLAIQVADHPLEYSDFEGRIEESYGKGDVEIWDSGAYSLISEGISSKLITLVGNKVKGDYYIRHWEGYKWLIWRK